MNSRARRFCTVLGLAGLVFAVALAGLDRLDRFSFAAEQGPLQPSPRVTSTPAPTPIPWLPTGRWKMVHGPKLEPLWSGGSQPAPSLRAVNGTWEGGRWIGWAVGDRGALAHYDGTSWTKRTDLDPSQQGGKNFHLRDVFVISSTLVWLVGAVEGQRNCDGCGFIMKYDGKTWRELDPYEYRVINQVAPLNAIDMIQDEAGRWWGWAVGDDASFDVVKAIIVRYTPELGWRLWTGPNNNTVNLNDVKIISSTEAWAVGSKGTETWYTERHGPGDWPRLGLSGADELYAVDLADRLFGWDGGFRGRMNHYYGQCHDGTDSTQCWFDNQAIPIENQQGNLWNFDVYGIDLLSRREGWLVGKANATQSLVARLDMNRKKWIRVDVGSDPGRHLYGLKMGDSRFGVAVGAEGVILEYHDDLPPTPTATPVPPTPPPSPTQPPATPTTVPPTSAPTSMRTPTSAPSPTPDEITPTQVSGSPTRDLASPTTTPTPSPRVTSATPSARPTATGATDGIRVFLPLAAKRAAVKKR